MLRSRRIVALAAFATALALALLPLPPSGSGRVMASSAGTADLGEYIVLGWNDLGMHCSNRNFADLCVLPPFNTMWATVIRRGDAGRLPQVMPPGMTVDYSIEDNTYSVGKTDFWTWAPAIFGVTLAPDVGLGGKGLSGSMDPHPDHFEALGVPLTPFTDSDLVHEQPFQIAHLAARDGLGGVVATTEIVAPVSNEMMCVNCHVPQAGETVEHAILRRHDSEIGTQLVNQRPVLCAKCHGSNALGLPGMPGMKSLSFVMHKQHAEQTNDCYQCHPGPQTQCLRDVMSQHYGMTCQDCHGSMLNVATTIEENGRRPWLDEPRCGTCHGTAYAEAPGTLYRNSHNGHGGLYCETCHSSPHAILPSREERDNRQNFALQGTAGTLRRCDVCHGVIPAAAGPHGLLPVDVAGRPATLPGDLLSCAPNPARGPAEIRYRFVDGRPAELAVHDAAGRRVRTLMSAAQTPGPHALVWDGRDSDGARVPTGVYFARLTTGGRTVSQRIVLLAP